MKYRKKPVVIEAYQWREEGPLDNYQDSRHSIGEWPDWLVEAQNKAATDPGAFFREGGKLLIKTLEGVHEVSDGDYIIQGVAGELYPCKPDIFEATYQAEEMGRELATGSVSDGYHTFDELYEHRHRLFLALMQAFPAQSWASKTHSDGTAYKGWFVCGMNLPIGQVSYHLPDRLWPEIERIGIHENVVPEFDGHTSDDVLERLAATSFAPHDAPPRA